MRLSQEFAQIFVTGPIFDQNGKDASILHRQFGADDRTHIVLACRDRESLRTINTVAIDQCHRWHLHVGRDLS